MVRKVHSLCVHYRMHQVESDTISVVLLSELVMDVPVCENDNLEEI